jgi:hypothetical protein
MTIARQRRRFCTVAMLMAVLATGAPAGAEPRLQLDWYRVEVILFERVTLDETAANEQLVADAPREFPHHLIPFDYDDAARQRIFRLSSEQLALPEPQVEEEEDGAAPDVDPATEPDLIASDEPAEALRIEPILVMPSVPELIATERAVRRRAEAIRQFEDQLRARAYQPLPAAENLLTREGARLRTNRSFDVVWHGAWVQPVPGRENPTPVLLQAGPLLGDRWAYEGTLAVTLGRFLHVHADVWRNLPPRHVEALHGSFRPAGSARAHGDPGYERLEEHRRMRSAELHYLDHPHFGILVRVDPVSIPEELLSLEAFLER